VFFKSRFCRVIMPATAAATDKNYTPVTAVNVDVPVTGPCTPTGRPGTPRAVASAASRIVLSGTELGGGKGSAVGTPEGPAMVAARRVSPGAPGRRSRQSSAIPPQKSNTSIMTVPKKAPVS